MGESERQEKLNEAGQNTTTNTSGANGMLPAANAGHDAHNHLGVRGLTKLEEKEVR